MIRQWVRLVKNSFKETAQDCFSTQRYRVPKATRVGNGLEGRSYFFLVEFISPFFLAKASPVGFSGEPDDIAGLVSYLASKESRFITGIDIVYFAFFSD